MTEVTVLGAGVVGLTTSVILQALGYKVSVVSERFLCDPEAESYPYFASAYPAASIIPHSVSIADGKKLLRDSTQVFSLLSGCSESGVKIQKHFELSEYGLPEPKYSSGLDNFEFCADTDTPILREGALSASGYSFDCYFCDMPVYGRWLLDTSKKIGIKHERRVLTPNLNCIRTTDLIVNCLGAGAHLIFEDILPGFFIKGVLLQCDYNCDLGAEIFSYNYTPSNPIHQMGDGAAGDVYFYPRSDHCVLGGTRIMGTQLSNSYEFVPSHREVSVCMGVDGTDVPRVIFELNKSLLKQMGVSIQHPKKALIGLRHLARNNETGEGEAIIQSQNRKGLPPIVDCIGFGGGGVTFSWGAGISVLNLLKNIEGRPKLPSNEVIELLRNKVVC